MKSSRIQRESILFSSIFREEQEMSLGEQFWGYECTICGLFKLLSMIDEFRELQYTRAAFSSSVLPIRLAQCRQYIVEG